MQTVIHITIGSVFFDYVLEDPVEAFRGQLAGPHHKHEVFACLYG